ncbi:MAG: hypothetical protein MHM6MM_009425, partial [Cercozoa sp. M6MM]
MVLITEEYTYDHDWRLVAQSYQERMRHVPSPELKGLDRIEFVRIRADTKQRRFEFIVRGVVVPDVPEFIKKAFDAQEIAFLSHTTIDYTRRGMKTVVTNESFRGRVLIR